MSSVEPPANSATSLLALASLLVAALGAALVPIARSDAVGAASLGCDRVASVSGSDLDPGTEAEPFQTAQHLVDNLRDGETGCLREGTFAGDDQVKVSGRGIGLRSFPGERATLQARLWIAHGADDVSVEDMVLDGRNQGDLPSPTVNGDRATFRDNEITNRNTSICFDVGSPVWGRARGTLIERNVIHECGRLPPTNRDHGVYIEAAKRTVIRNNLIYDNADRGIQLYPDADRTHVVGNVIDGNGQGVILGGKGRQVSAGNRVSANVISNSNVRWNVESLWTGRRGGRNVVRGNCLWAGNAPEAYRTGGGVQRPSKGFRARGNVVADPQFVDRPLGELAPHGTCAGILAAGRAPGLTLSTSRRKVRAGRPLALRGLALGVAEIDLVTMHGGEWEPVTSVAPRGSEYGVRIKAGPAGTARFKATAAGARDSRTVRVRVRR